MDIIRIDIHRLLKSNLSDYRMKRYKNTKSNPKRLYKLIVSCGGDNMSNINDERKRYEQFLFNKINYILFLKRNNLEENAETKKMYDESDEYKNIKEIFDQIYGE